ncbi:MAG: PorT family protein [Prevotella sp.]|nr:PorT family protein [Prevotella sp.]MCM1074907.1 PorT family protein [Ruminococcus sp.]
MKKKIILLLLSLICIQAAFAQFRWGVTAGFNYEKYHFKQDLMQVDASPGFSAGIIGELMFPGIGFGMDFGLNYEMHGSKLHLGDQVVWASSGYGTEQSYIHLIQIPINLRFKYTKLNGIEQKIAPFVFVGPVFNIRCGNNNVPALEYSSGSIGLQTQLGLELFRKFQISGGYYWDFTYEARTKKLENFSQHPQGWVVKASYFFK